MESHRRPNHRGMSRRGWVELVAGLSPSQAHRLCKQLGRAGIDHSSRLTNVGIDLAVPEPRYEDAAFVMAMVSFERPAARTAPEAELKPSWWRRLRNSLD